MEPVQTPKEEPKKRWPAAIAAAIMALAIAVLLFVADRPAHKPIAFAAVKAAAVSPRPVAALGNWTYTSTPVELTGEKQDLACTTSTEGARLCFRRTGTRLESYLRFPDDTQQFLCTRYHCTTQIRIDDQPVFSTVGNESPDGNIAMVYLGQPQRLLSLLRSAKRAEFGPPMYEQDGLVLHFRVSGLNDFGEVASTKTATVGSRVPRHVDPRLTAPISPIDPPALSPQTEAPSLNPKLGVA